MPLNRTERTVGLRSRTTWGNIEQERMSINPGEIWVHRAGLPQLIRVACALGYLAASAAALGAGTAPTPEEIIAALRKPSSSTGNIADAVEEATGARGFMYHDMKPVFKAKIAGHAATALLRPGLK